MYIREFQVKNLNGELSYKLKFNEDLNIITGRNGSGKTTVLKLMWYLISGNVELAIQEIDFNSAKITTDRFMISVEKNSDQDGDSHYTIYFSPNDQDKEIKINGNFERLIRTRRLFEMNQGVATLMGQTVFFPTFRRIEGGFSVGSTNYPQIITTKHGSRVIRERYSDRVHDSLNELSTRLSDGNHRFVCSISTDDIVKLITKQYADASETINEHYRELSTSIIETISGYKTTQTRNEKKYEEAISILDKIQADVSGINEYREKLLKPFSVLSDLISDIFQHEGIKISDAVTLGDSASYIDSSKLSAGEKQMLSFLCYNSFASQCPIFIDEPELSLHVDWQRLLFPTLLEQETKNQFIVATHSPFIYSKYEDKEIMLNEDKGGE